MVKKVGVTQWDEPILVCEECGSECHEEECTYCDEYGQVENHGAETPEKPLPSYQYVECPQCRGEGSVLVCPECGPLI